MPQSRQLSVIMFTDIVGYTALMGHDEKKAYALLDKNRKLQRPLIEAFHGRWIKEIGDGVLASFQTVSDAVHAAVKIQEACNLAKDFQLRIGIHQGEIVFEADDIFGNAVNIAARIQAAASPGCIFISESIHSAVIDIPEISTRFVKEEMLRNVAQPVRMYQVLFEGSDIVIAEDRAVHNSIAVLPFVNMSSDPEQEYFSDGITEDVITDLSKVSALAVISRNSAFVYKGRHVDVPRIARELNVSHVLEGSVRKAGGRVRITAQLVDATSNDHVWAERYDRDLSDIFALQDEISQAIVAALKLKLLPSEKKAIEQRGTDNVEAYNLYLMAWQHYVTGHRSEEDVQGTETIIRLCRRATEIDPGYAQAWALMAIGQMILHFAHGRAGDDGLAAIDKALVLNPDLAEAHAIKARILSRYGRQDEAASEIDTALRLDPDSFEVNRSAAYWSFRQQRLEDAIRYWEKAMTLMSGDAHSPSMLITCYTAIGDLPAARRVAGITLARAESLLEQDHNNWSAIAHGASALATLGEAERAKEWMRRALLIQPDRMELRYNFACTLAAQLNETDAAIVMLGPVMAKLSLGFLNHAKVDPDLDPLRENPRFKAMVAAAEARFATATEGGSAAAS